MAWYRAFRETLASLSTFLEEHCKVSLAWKVNGPAISLQSNAPSNPSEEHKAPAKPAAPRPTPVPVHPPETSHATNRDPKKFEKGVSWVFQDFERNPNLVLEEAETGMMKGVMLDRLSDCTVVIKGKVKNILITACKKVTVQCQSVVASTEIVACKGLKLQTLGLLPSVAIDGSDGVQIFLNAESKAECVFATSKSSDMTVNFQQLDGPRDWVELPIPHQFVHHFQGDRLDSQVSDLYR